MKDLIKNIYIVFDSECLICNSFVKLIDNNYVNKSQKLFLVSDLNILTKFLKDYSKLKFFKSLQNKTIIVILSEEEFLLRSRAIAYLLSMSNNKFHNFIGAIINIVPISIADTIYDFISTHRKSFFKSNKCIFYYPKNIKLLK